MEDGCLRDVAIDSRRDTSHVRPTHQCRPIASSYSGWGWQEIGGGGRKGVRNQVFSRSTETAHDTKA